MIMYKKNIKESLKSGATIFGTWNGIPSPAVANAIGLSGIDFVVVDTEHGPAGIETAENIIRALDATQTPSIIRVSTNRQELILRALDIGPVGVQIPHISTKEQAQKVLSYAKYYPKGCRGFTPFTRAGNYAQDPKGYAERANNNTMVIVNVEGSEGIDNLEEIASVKDIDVIFIGPYDLSQSLGKPGDVEDADVIKSIRNSVAVAKDRGIACGSFAKDLNYLDILIDCGVQYITYTVDSALIADTYRSLYTIFNERKNRVKK